MFVIKVGTFFLKVVMGNKLDTIIFTYNTYFWSPLTPDGPQVKSPPPSLQITSNFLAFYGFLHGTTLKKKGVAVF